MLRCGKWGYILRRSHLLGSAALVAVAIVLSLPALAAAADTYVDQESGDDSNSCLGPGLDACEHIQAAITKAGTGDTIHVADPMAPPATYAESVALNSGKSLVADSPDPAETAINSPTTNPAITVVGSPAGTISGFTITGPNLALDLEDSATVQGNIFNQASSAATLNAVVNIGSTASPTITGNTFTDPSPGDNQIAILNSSGATPQITANAFAGFTEAILTGSSASSAPTIDGNDISGIRGDASAGAGIAVINGVATITHNYIHDPSYDPNPPNNEIVAGISIFEVAGTDPGANLKRNTILGHETGVKVYNTSTPVTLHSDLIAKSYRSGLLAQDPVADAGGDDVTAENV